MIRLIQIPIAHYTGLSTDSRPSEPSVGSLLFETDTGREFIYDGKEWVQSKNRIGTFLDQHEESLDAILKELRKINSHLETVTGLT